MMWAEFVRLRAASEQDLAGRIKEMVGTFPGDPGLLEARVYVNAEYEGDVCLRLLWDTPSIPRHGSDLGLFMSRAMRSMGLVDHTRWIEAGSTEPSTVPTRAPRTG